MPQIELIPHLHSSVMSCPHQHLTSLSLLSSTFHFPGFQLHPVKWDTKNNMIIRSHITNINLKTQLNMLLRAKTVEWTLLHTLPILFYLLWWNECSQCLQNELTPHLNSSVMSTSTFNFLVSPMIHVPLSRISASTCKMTKKMRWL